MHPESPRLTRTAGPGGYAFPPVPMDGIYLDYNGSAPLDPRVAEVMARALSRRARERLLRPPFRLPPSRLSGSA